MKLSKSSDLAFTAPGSISELWTISAYDTYNVAMDEISTFTTNNVRVLTFNVS